MYGSGAMVMIALVEGSNGRGARFVQFLDGDLRCNRRDGRYGSVSYKY